MECTNINLFRKQTGIDELVSNEAIEAAIISYQIDNNTTEWPNVGYVYSFVEPAVVDAYYSIPLARVGQLVRESVVREAPLAEYQSFIDFSRLHPNIANSIRSNMDNIPVRVFTNGNRAFYSTEEGVIYVPERSTIIDSGDITHEAIHATTAFGIHIDSVFHKELSDIIDRAKKIEGSTKFAYFLTKPDELLAGAYSDPEFSDFLRGVGLWNRILRAIAKFFGITYSRDLLAEIDQIISTKPNAIGYLPFLTQGYSEDLLGAVPLSEEVDRFRDTEAFRRLKEKFNIEIEFDEVLGEYWLLDASGNKISKLIRISEVKEMAGYGFDDSRKSRLNPKNLETSQVVGSAIHSLIYRILFGTSPKNNQEYSFSDEVIEDMKVMLHAMFPGYDMPGGTEILMAEDILADTGFEFAGSPDILVRTKSGKIRLVDFKTKIVHKPGFDGQPPTTSSWKWYNYKKEGHSTSDQHQFQLEGYRILFENNGAQIDEVGIIPLSVTLTHSIDGRYEYTIDKVTFATHIATMNDSDGRGFHRFKFNAKVISDVRNAMDVKLSAAQRLDFKRMKDTHAALNKVLGMLAKHSDALKRTGKEASAKVIASELVATENLEFADTVFSVLRSVIGEMADMEKEFDLLKEKEKTLGLEYAWDIDTLHRWLEFAESTAVVNELVNVINNFPDVFDNLSLSDEESGEVVSYEDIKDLAESVLSSKTQMETAIRLKANEVYATKMSKFHTTYEARVRDDREALWKKKFVEQYGPNRKFTPADRDEMNKATDLYIKNHKDEIKELSVEFISKLMKFTNMDENLAESWFASIFDAADAIVGASNKMFFGKHIEMNRKNFDHYLTLNQIYQEFQQGLNIHSYKNLKDVYSFMLEESDGKFYLVDEITPEFAKARNAFWENLQSGNFTSEEKAIKYNEWLAEHNPLADEEAFIDHLLDYYRDLFNRGVLLRSELDALVDNEEKLPEYKRSIPELAMGKNPEIRRSVADLINSHRKEVERSHRRPNKARYGSKKYEAIMALPDTDPKKKLYIQLKEMFDEANSMIPYRYRLFNRLPGQRKGTAERLGTDGMMSVVEEFKKYNFTTNQDPNDPMYLAGTSVQEEGSMYEAARENNMPLRFIPIHFVGELTEQEQSFDLPTVIMEFYKSANNYNSMRDIVGELEYTARILRERKIGKKSKKKSVFNALIPSFNKTNPTVNIEEEEVLATTNYISTMYAAWLNQVVYGVKNENIPVWAAKMASKISSYTSLKIMGLNLFALFNNKLVGEANQLNDAFAGHLMNLSSYHTGKLDYYRDVINIVGDVGAAVPTSKQNLLDRRFLVFDDEYEHPFREATRLKRAWLTESAFHYTIASGEHSLQSIFLNGALRDAVGYKDEAMTEKVSDMYEAFTKHPTTKKLERNPEIKFVKVKWHNDLLPVDDFEVRLAMKILSTSRALHGNYARITAVMAQANSISSMALTFRKWMPSGIQRRWGSRYYDETSEEWRTPYLSYGLQHAGSYIQAGWFTGLSFFSRLGYEAKAASLFMQARYDLMTEDQQRAIKQFYFDVALYLFIGALMFAASIRWPEEDRRSLSRDEKAEYDRQYMFLNHVLYQIYRLQTEVGFYVNPFDMIKIVKSPMAASTTLSDIARLFNQITSNPFERYTTGKDKDAIKSWVMIKKQLPVYRQWLRAKDPVQQKKALDLMF